MALSLWFDLSVWLAFKLLTKAIWTFRYVMKLCYTVYITSLVILLLLLLVYSEVLLRCDIFLVKVFRNLWWACSLSTLCKKKRKRKTKHYIFLLITCCGNKYSFSADIVSDGRQRVENYDKWWLKGRGLGLGAGLTNTRFSFKAVDSALLTLLRQTLPTLPVLLTAVKKRGTVLRHAGQSLHRGGRET